MEGATVQPGQTWADNDKRSIGRKVRVDSIDSDYANCTVVADRSAPGRTPGRYNVQRPEGWSPVKPTSAGYWLVED